MKKILSFIVGVILKYNFLYNIINNDGKFKVGDIVVYNWMAKAHIYSAVKYNLGPRTVSKICYKDKSGLDFEDGGSCAAFWVRKLR